MTFLPTDDPVGGVVFLALFLLLGAFGLWFLLAVLKVSKNYLRMVDAFVYFSALVFGLVLLWAASTILVPVVPLIVAGLGAVFSAFGIYGLKQTRYG